MRTINGFWHIWAINNYMEIIAEQFKLILESGLYYRCNKIYIGIIGNYDNLKEIKAFFADYDKVKLEAFSQNAKEYEYLTLKALKRISNVAQIDFYGFYIHTKAVSFPTLEGGKYWRDYMNFYNLTDWKNAYKALESGYDTYGVKMLTEKDEPARKLHYSGNFFWFKSIYAKKLKPVETCDLKNRIGAEMYICSAKPKAANGCSLFVDYNQKGTFKPPIK